MTNICQVMQVSHSLQCLKINVSKVSGLDIVLTALTLGNIAVDSTLLSNAALVFNVLCSLTTQGPRNFVLVGL